MSKLYEIIEKPLTGEWGEEDETGIGIPVLRTTNFTNEGVINYSNVVTRIIDPKKIKEKYLINGDIIIEKSGGSSTQPVGRVVFFEGENNRYLFNNFTSVLRLKNQDNISPKYLFYFLYAGYKQGKTRKFQNKTTGISNLKLDRFIKEMEISLPPLETQKQIANSLDTAAELLAMRKQQLADLDNLIKSIFNTMFGNPIKNQKGWSLSRLGNFITVKHGFAFSGEYFSNKGDHVLLTPGNFYEEGGYRDRGDKQKYYLGDIPQEYLLNEGDLLIAMTEQAPGLLGSPLIVPNSNKFLHNQRLGLVKYNESYLNTFYLFHLFNHQNIRKLIYTRSTGTKVRHTSPSKVEEIEVSLPPLYLQNKFSTIVTKIEEQKVFVKKAIDESKYLFDSLMAQYFE